MRNSSKIRDQLEKTLVGMAPLKDKAPFKGWIRSIREAIGMSGRQLAQRIQVEPSRIPEMEKAETQGNITVKSLRRAAEAMDCELVFAFVPKTSLEVSLRSQARKAAREKLGTVSHTMRLEDQGLSVREDAELQDKLVEDWVRNPPRWLWDAV